MKNLIQKYMMAIVAVMMVIGFSAFKSTMTLAPNNNWYYTDVNDELHPLIGGPQDECDPNLEEGDECAVQTKFPVPPSTTRSSLMPGDIENIAFYDED